MTDPKHNRPPVNVELSADLAEFLLENCDANLRVALANLQSVSRTTAEALVAQMEKFKAVKAAIQAGRRP